MHWNAACKTSGMRWCIQRSFLRRTSTRMTVIRSIWPGGFMTQFHKRVITLGWVRRPKSGWVITRGTGL
eukprot:6144880-Lingulodinium_polyedra.AAC.1